MHIFDSERRILEILWEKGEATAKEMADRLEGEIGWNRNTTYTVIKKCVAKGLVEREEPHFVCRALVSREEAREEAARSVLDSWFGGSVNLLFASLLDRKGVTEEELETLRELIDRKGE